MKNKIKTHYRDKGKQVSSSKEKVKSCRNKSKPITFLTIPKALIKATFVQKIRLRHTTETKENKLSRVRNRSSQGRNKVSQDGNKSS